MKLNRLACSFLCLLLILGLQGCGQKKDANSSEKISDVVTTNKPVESGKIPDLPRQTGSEKSQRPMKLQVTWRNSKPGRKKETTSPNTNSACCMKPAWTFPKDYEEAAKWFRKAAEQGLDAAQWSLGVLYENGEGVPKDYQEAAKWYRKALNKEMFTAQFSLGVMYMLGNGVPQNYVDAVE